MSKITQAAKGEACTLQLHPYCNMNTETTVLCHLNSEDKGWAIKSPDWFGVFGCNVCHDIIDGRRQTEITKLEIEQVKIRALYRTWKRLIALDLIKIVGDKK